MTIPDGRSERFDIYDLVAAANAAHNKTISQDNYIPVPFGADFLFDPADSTYPSNYTLAKWLLYQSGPLKEFGPLEQGDQIDILAFEVNIFGIKIIAKLGDITKTFYLKTQRAE